MDLQDLLDEFRNQVADQALPHLWEDEEILRYIIDAQDQFVRKTGGIADMSTTAIVDLVATAATPFTAHSPYILRILSGRMTTARIDVEFVLESDLNLLRERDYGSKLKYTLDDTDTGEVRYGILGLEEKKVRWLRVPLTTDTCRIRVLRLPYPRIVDWDSVPLEIDDFHHMHLLKWMKYLAYSKQDAEARNDKLAADNEAAFVRYCDESRKEIDKRRYRPRVVQYGG